MLVEDFIGIAQGDAFCGECVRSDTPTDWSLVEFIGVAISVEDHEEMGNELVVPMVPVPLNPDNDDEDDDPEEHRRLTTQTS